MFLSYSLVTAYVIFVVVEIWILIRNTVEEKLKFSQLEAETARVKVLSLLKEYSHQEREVTLASGQKSNFYLDCKQTMFLGEAAFLVGEIFYELLGASKKKYSACGGMALGAVPLVVSLSMIAYMHGEILPGLVVRKDVKDHGTRANIEGALSVPRGSRVILLEDVITTGGSTIAAAKQFREQGYEVDAVFALVDRQSGGENNLREENLTLSSLFLLSDFY